MCLCVDSYVFVCVSDPLAFKICVNLQCEQQLKVRVRACYLTLYNDAQQGCC